MAPEVTAAAHKRIQRNCRARTAKADTVPNELLQRVGLRRAILPSRWRKVRRRAGLLPSPRNKFRCLFKNARYKITRFQPSLWDRLLDIGSLQIVDKLVAVTYSLLWRCWCRQFNVGVTSITRVTIKRFPDFRLRTQIPPNN